MIIEKIRIFIDLAISFWNMLTIRKYETIIDYTVFNPLETVPRTQSPSEASIAKSSAPRQQKLSVAQEFPKQEASKSSSTWTERATV